MYAMSGIECEAFTNGYIEAVAWANVCFEDEARDGGLENETLPDDVIATLRQDCADFLDEHTERLIRGAVRRSREQRGSWYGAYGFYGAGHDFALTRNGHGAGFWDRGLGLVGEALTAISKPYGDRTLYVALDGTVSTD